VFDERKAIFDANKPYDQEAELSRKGMECFSLAAGPNTRSKRSRRSRVHSFYPVLLTLAAAFAGSGP